MTDGNYTCERSITEVELLCCLRETNVTLCRLYSKMFFKKRFRLLKDIARKTEAWGSYNILPRFFFSLVIA